VKIFPITPPRDFAIALFFLRHIEKNAADFKTLSQKRSDANVVIFVWVGNIDPVELSDSDSSQRGAKVSVYFSCVYKYGRSIVKAK
jgi:hypothetical protein